MAMPQRWLRAQRWVPGRRFDFEEADVVLGTTYGVPDPKPMFFLSSNDPFGVSRLADYQTGCPRVAWESHGGVTRTAEAHTSLSWCYSQYQNHLLYESRTLLVVFTFRLQHRGVERLGGKRCRGGAFCLMRISILMRGGWQKAPPSLTPNYIRKTISDCPSYFLSPPLCSTCH